MALPSPETKGRMMTKVSNDTAGAILRRVAILDCESTGLGLQDEAIAIAAIVVDVDSKGNATRVAAWEGKQCPTVDIHPAAARVHGLTKESLAGQSFDLRAFETAMTGVRCFVAHNAVFDARLIGKVTPAIMRGEWRCSYRQWAWPKLDNKKLDTVCRHFNVERPATHNAMHDAEALLQALLVKSGKTDRSMTYLGKLLAKDDYRIRQAIEADRSRASWRDDRRRESENESKTAIRKAIFWAVAIGFLAVAFYFKK
jgi:DNA polymerase III subunit epsilon